MNALNDDLNTPKALAVLWGLVKDKKVSPADKKKTLMEFDAVLGLGIGRQEKEKIPDEVLKLAEKREIHRKNRGGKNPTN